MINQTPVVNGNMYSYKAVDRDGNPVEIMAVEVSPEFSGVEFEREMVIQAFKDEGFEKEADRFGEIKKKTAFTRAVRSEKQRRKNESIDLIKDTSVISYQISKKEVKSNDGKEEIDFLKKNVIMYDKLNDVIRAEDPESEEMIRNRVAEKQKTYTREKVYHIFKLILSDWGMIPFGRGTFVLPGCKYDDVKKLSKVFNKIDPNGKFWLRELPFIQGNVESYKISIDEEKENYFAEVKKKFEILKNDGKSMTERIYNNSIEELNAEIDNLTIASTLAQYKLDEINAYRAEIHRFLKSELDKSNQVQKEEEVVNCPLETPIEMAVIEKKEEDVVKEMLEEATPSLLDFSDEEF